MPDTTGPYENTGPYGPEAAPVLPMPDTVTYRCHDCGAEISHRDPFTAHELYVGHLDTHDPGPDPEPLTPAEVAELEDRAARYAEHPVVYPLDSDDRSAAGDGGWSTRVVPAGDARHWSDGTGVDPAELAANHEVPD